jgi:hypothetical protein
MFPEPGFKGFQVVLKPLKLPRRDYDFGAPDNLDIIKIRTAGAGPSHMLELSGARSPLVQLSAPPLKVDASSGIAAFYLQDMVDRDGAVKVLMGLMGAAKHIAAFVLIDKPRGRRHKRLDFAEQVFIHGMHELVCYSLILDDAAGNVKPMCATCPAA